MITGASLFTENGTLLFTDYKCGICSRGLSHIPG